MSLSLKTVCDALDMVHPYFTVAPNMRLFRYQMCLIKCYYCLHVFRKSNWFGLAYGFLFSAFMYRLYCWNDPMSFLKVVFGWFLVFPGLAYTVPCLELPTMVLSVLRFRALEFAVDYGIALCVPADLMSVDVFETNFVKSSTALLWIVFVLRFPFSPALLSLAEYEYFVYALIAGTFIAGSMYVPSERWMYLLLASVFCYCDHMKALPAL